MADLTDRLLNQALRLRFVEAFASTGNLHAATTESKADFAEAAVFMNDPMFCQKMIQSLWVYEAKHGRKDRALVVTPTRSTGNWSPELLEHIRNGGEVPVWR